MRIHWYTKYCTCRLYTICWVLDISRYLCNYHHNQGNERIHHVQKFPRAKDGNDNPICKTEKKTQMYRTVFWTLWEKERVGCFKRTASKHVYYLGWSRSPALVGCMRQALGPGALGRPRGIGWRGRWVGGSGWGIHVSPWLIHVNVWQTTTIL